MKILLAALILCAWSSAGSAAAVCLGGRSDHWVLGEICERSSGYCVRVCFAEGYWDSGGGLVSLAEMMSALSLGGLSAEQVLDDFDTYGPPAFRWRRDDYGPVDVRLVECWSGMPFSSLGVLCGS